MTTEEVEIYSDATNAAVIRHPGRRFPGVLLQGDTLHALCVEADVICDEVGRNEPGFDTAMDLRDRLRSLLLHYRTTLTEHDLDLPFVESLR